MIAEEAAAADVPVRFEAPAGATPVGLTLVAIGVVAGALIALFHLDRLPFVFCWFKLTTGYPCMSCGATRAVGRLAHGDLAGAFWKNPLATVGILGGVVPWAVADAVLAARGRALRIVLAPAARRTILAVGLVLVLVNWAYLVSAGL